jgi:predicted membrane protein
MVILGMWSIIALFLFSIIGLASKNIVILFWIFYFGQLFYRYLNNNSQVYTKHKYYHLVASIILLFLILFPIDFCVRGSHYYSVYICPIVYQYHTRIPEAKENLKGKQTNKDFVVYETYSHSIKAIYS